MTLILFKEDVEFNERGICEKISHKKQEGLIVLLCFCTFYYKGCKKKKCNPVRAKHANLVTANYRQIFCFLEFNLRTFNMFKVPLKPAGRCF